MEESNGVPIDLVVDGDEVQRERDALIADLADKRHMTLAEARAVFYSFDRALHTEDA